MAPGTVSLNTFLPEEDLSEKVSVFCVRPNTERPKMLKLILLVTDLRFETQNSLH